MSERTHDHRKELHHKPMNCDRGTHGLTIYRTMYYYFFVFATIYIEFGFRMLSSGMVSGTVRMVLLLLVCVPLLPRFFRFKYQSRPLLLFIYLGIVIVANIFRDMDFKNNILLIVPIFVGFLVSVTIDIRHIIHIFSNVMVFLAAFSLVIFVIRAIAPNIIEMLPYVDSVFNSSLEMHDAFFAVSNLNSRFLRNFGFAWEPGAFAVLLSVAIYCNLTFYSKLNLRRIFILILALITTFSTMGYFVLAAIYLVSLKRFDNSKKATRAIVALTIFLVIILILLPSSATDLVFSKLDGLFEGESSSTTQARLNAIEFPGRAFLSSPLFGVGYENFSYINTALCNNVATNTIVNWFAIMGLLLGLPCLWNYVGFAKKCSLYVGNGFFGFIVLVFAFALMISTESLLRISLVYVIIFYGCQRDVLNEKEIKRMRMSRRET